LCRVKHTAHPPRHRCDTGKNFNCKAHVRGCICPVVQLQQQLRRLEAELVGRQLVAAPALARLLQPPSLPSSASSSPPAPSQSAWPCPPMRPPAASPAALWPAPARLPPSACSRPMECTSLRAPPAIPARVCAAPSRQPSPGAAGSPSATLPPAPRSGRASDMRASAALPPPPPRRGHQSASDARSAASASSGRPCSTRRLASTWRTCRGE
jgi:hypothetical protein